MFSFIFAVLAATGSRAPDAAAVEHPQHARVLTIPSGGQTPAVAFAGGTFVVRAGEDRLFIELTDVVTAGAVNVAPVVDRGALRTKRLDGERWKCVPSADGPPKWRVDDNTEIAVTSVPLSAGPRQSLEVRPAFANAQTRELELRFAVGGVAETFRVIAERPLEPPPALAEMLRQYQKIGPTLLKRAAASTTFVRVKPDLCGDSRLVEEVFSEATITVLGYPSPDWRLGTAFGWVFAEHFDPNDLRGVRPLAIDDLEVKNITYLGDPYERQLANLAITPGQATAVFSLGDFAKCFGASCGDPVNVRTAHVTLSGGVLSTKIKRAAPAP